MSNASESAVTSRSEAPTTGSTAYEKGQRLVCSNCQSEVEIINPCTCHPPDMKLQCCGEPMQASTGVRVNVNVEA